MVLPLVCACLLHNLLHSCALSINWTRLRGAGHSARESFGAPNAGVPFLGNVKKKYKNYFLKPVFFFTTHFLDIGNHLYCHPYVLLCHCLPEPIAGEIELHLFEHCLGPGICLDPEGFKRLLKYFGRYSELDYRLAVPVIIPIIGGDQPCSWSCMNISVPGNGTARDPTTNEQ